MSQAVVVSVVLKSILRFPTPELQVSVRNLVVLVLTLVEYEVCVCAERSGDAIRIPDMINDIKRMIDEAD
jgi:hypothetical protein